ncbi:MAG: hypothetical protein PUC44_03755 [Eubacteriales bacterium]|nr:hypothetical protein [Eubacteriales bacterium]
MSTYKHKTKSKHHPFLFFILILVLAAVLIGRFIVYPRVLHAASVRIAEQMIESAENTSGTSENAETAKEKAEEIYNSMDESDQKTIDNIIKNHANSETIEKAREYLKSGDSSELKQYLKSSLTEEEQQQLQDLYNKYVASGN